VKSVFVVAVLIKTPCIYRFPTTRTLLCQSWWTTLWTWHIKVSLSRSQMSIITLYIQVVRKNKHAAPTFRIG